MCVFVSVCTRVCSCVYVCGCLHAFAFHVCVECVLVYVHVCGVCVHVCSCMCVSVWMHVFTEICLKYKTVTSKKKKKMKLFALQAFVFLLGETLGVWGRIRIWRVWASGIGALLEFVSTSVGNFHSYG